MNFNTLIMKRGREEAGDDITTMANYLMLLSGAAISGGGHHQEEDYGRVFTCKTCNRQFSSFQALGGHRASHKKPRLMGGAGDGVVAQPASPPKPKTHECSICGLEFPLGQALGGHMRRHRAATAADDDRKLAETTLSLSTATAPAATIVKKAANNSRRVLCLDLNLTPLENTFVFGKTAPVVDCFF